MCESDQVLNVFMKCFPRVSSTNCLCFCYCSSEAILLLSLIECLLRKLYDLKDFSNRIMTMGPESEGSHFQIIADMAIDHG